MTVAVLDASLAIGILLEDEWTEAVPSVQQELHAADLHVPAHWGVEIASMLVSAQRRKRITPDDCRFYLSVVSQLPFTADQESALPSQRIASLAIEAGLSVYDAAYLDLALRTNGSLASNDRALIAAGRKHGLNIITTLA